MAAIAKVISRVFPETDFKDDPLIVIALLLGVGLVVSLLVLTYGLDFGIF